MKNVFILIAFVAMTLAVQSQITIERSDYTFDPSVGFESVHVYEGGLSIPTVGENQLWNYSELELGFKYWGGSWEPGTDEAFPNANYFAMGGQSPFGDWQDIEFWYQFNDEQEVVLGRKLGYTPSGISSVTGNVLDSVILIGNTDVYANPIWIMKFPLEYGTQAHSELDLTVDFELTVQSFGIDKQPGYNLQEYTNTWEVEGWGTIILPHPDGGEPISMEALLIKETSSWYDYYYLNGELASPILTAAFNLEQGKLFSYTTYRFYAKGMPRSVLSIRYNNETQAFVSGSMSSDIASLASVADAYNGYPLAANVYPNPVSSKFNLRFDKTDSQVWSLELYDMTGRVIQVNSINQEAGEVNTMINLSDCASGIVNYSIRNSNGKIMAAGKFIKE